MDIDYRKWAPGVALAKKIILVPCLVCGEPCHERRTKANTRFVHVVRIERHTPKINPKEPDKPRKVRNKVVICKMCKLSGAERASKEDERDRARKAAKLAEQRA